jgi:hypothetical protein
MKAAEGKASTDDIPPMSKAENHHVKHPAKKTAAKQKAAAKEKTAAD